MKKEEAVAMVNKALDREFEVEIYFTSDGEAGETFTMVPDPDTFHGTLMDNVPSACKAVDIVSKEISDRNGWAELRFDPSQESVHAIEINIYISNKGE